MDRQLLSWRDNAIAIDELIARAERTIDIVDHNLSLQGWETLARTDALRTAMHDRNVQVRIVLNDAKALTKHFPRHVQLLKTHGHRLAILQTKSQPKPEQFLAVADGQHCIFRPVLVRSEGFADFENPGKSMAYLAKVNVIWDQGGQKLFPEAFGL